jgi:hypothetical protein
VKAFAVMPWTSPSWSTVMTVTPVCETPHGLAEIVSGKAHTETSGLCLMAVFRARNHFVLNLSLNQFALNRRRTIRRGPSGK